MNSQVTLVDPAFPSGACSITLVYDRRDMKYTTVSRPESNEIVYKIDSDASSTRTTIYRPGAIILATLDRRQILPNMITFQGAEPIKVSKWLKSDFLGSLPAVFEEAGRKYTWKITGFMYHLALFEELVSETKPIAWFQPSQKRLVDGVPTLHPASLSLTPQAEHIQDLVVVSLLIAYEMAKGSTRGL